jgi:hypothetical protein
MRRGLAAYAIGNAVPGGLSSVERVRQDMADRVEAMVAAMPPEVAARFKIISGYRSAERQAQVNPGVKNSRHTDGSALDLQHDPVVFDWINKNPQHGVGFPLKHMKNEQNHLEMLDASGGRYVPAGGGFKSGLARGQGGTGSFGLADANLPEPITQDYSGGGDPPEAPSDDNRALLAALALRNSPFGGGFGGPGSLSSALTQGMQPAAPELTPIVQPQPGIVGGPLPIAQKLR